MPHSRSLAKRTAASRNSAGSALPTAVSAITGANDSSRNSGSVAAPASSPGTRVHGRDPSRLPPMRGAAAGGEALQPLPGAGVVRLPIRSALERRAEEGEELVTPGPAAWQDTTTRLALQSNAALKVRPLATSSAWKASSLSE